MNKAQIVSLIGDLTNDPNHDRYTQSQIETELDVTQSKWNVAAGILRDTETLTVVSGQAYVALSGLTGTLIDIARATHKGKELLKRSKQYFDLYNGEDWTVYPTGTPVAYAVDLDPDNLRIYFDRIPQDDDAGAYLGIEYIKAHTTMASDSDSPWNSHTLLTPYHYGVAYDVAARMLIRDPSQINAAKSGGYQIKADGCLADIIQVFKGLEKEEPMRLRGGRSWI